MKKTFLLFAAVLFVGSMASLKADPALRIGDSFELRIAGVPTMEMSAFNNTYTIDGGGQLNLPYINKVTVKDMTASQIQALIERIYIERGIYQKPTITLAIAQTARFVNVSGQVRSAGRVPYAPDMTVMTAIAAAGDFTEYADPGRVIFTRRGVAKMVNCKEMRKDPSKDFPVEPGDQIVVKQGFW